MGLAGILHRPIIFPGGINKLSVSSRWKICILPLIILLGTLASAYADEANILKGATPPENGIWLESLDLAISQLYGSPHAALSVDCQPISIGGEKFQHGLGCHAFSDGSVYLDRCAVRFMALVGVDDENSNRGSVEFEVYVDGRKAFSSGVIRGGDKPKFCSVDLRNARQMTLRITDAGDGRMWDHADWGGAVLILKPGVESKFRSLANMADKPMKIASCIPSKKPMIHGPRVVGATPGHDFLFLVPATGEEPLTYSAENLPAGLSLNSRTGIISGSLKSEGETVVTLTVKGPKGKATRRLKIIGGFHKLAQTPPMGWNSWNVWAAAIDDQKIRAAADDMIKSGLAAHGYQYINMDDTWEGKRDETGELHTNAKFPDMKGLADYVHSKGLKFGIYSSPGDATCGGYEGSYQHEAQDANTWAKWGIDYLKYDWCTYEKVVNGDESRPNAMRPYKLMRKCLDASGRDIVYSLCQYGMANVWEWGESIGANSWRTNGDIIDTWPSMVANGLSQNGHEKYAGPGHWNDPDMLVVGKVGWGPSIHDSRLSHNAQITHITLWSLQSSIMLVGCDISQMDRFTLDLLTNDEVLDVNQDPLGQPAGCLVDNGLSQIWARKLWDGTTAVGLFNLGNSSRDVTVKWSDLGISGSQWVRNLWLKRDEGTFSDSFTARIGGQGAVMIKVGAPDKTDW